MAPAEIGVHTRVWHVRFAPSVKYFKTTSGKDGKFKYYLETVIYSHANGDIKDHLQNWHLLLYLTLPTPLGIFYRFYRHAL